MGHISYIVFLIEHPGQLKVRKIFFNQISAVLQPHCSQKHCYHICLTHHRKCVNVKTLCWWTNCLHWLTEVKYWRYCAYTLKTTEVAAALKQRCGGTERSDALWTRFSPQCKCSFSETSRERHAKNSATSHRDDSSAKPPSRSRTLQKRTPLTKGTDDSSSKSKSTLNLKRFFLLRRNDMSAPSAEQGSPGLWKERRSTRRLTADRLPRKATAAVSAGGVQTRFKVQISSFPTHWTEWWRRGKFRGLIGHHRCEEMK